MQVRKRVSVQDLQALDDLQQTVTLSPNFQSALSCFLVRADETGLDFELCSNPSCCQADKDSQLEQNAIPFSFFVVVAAACQLVARLLRYCYHLFSSATSTASIKLYKCDRCGGLARYCCRSCQTAHWAVHKQHCIPETRHAGHATALARRLMAPDLPGLRRALEQFGAAELRGSVVWVDMLCVPAELSIVRTGVALAYLESHAGGGTFSESRALASRLGCLCGSDSEVTQAMVDRDAAAARGSGSLKREELMPAVMLYKSRPVFCPKALPLAVLCSKPKQQ